MNTMSFFADRAARNAKLDGNVDASSLLEMVPALCTALLTVLSINAFL